MAIDLIITPLSKYWSGDYITPVMQEAWDAGVAYEIVTLEGTIAMPKGIPFGGKEAKETRTRLVEFVHRLLDSIPVDGLSSSSWDETTDSVFEWKRVDTDSFGALVAEAERQFSSDPGVLGRLTGKKRRHCHLTSASIFLPVAFDALYKAEDIVFGSLTTVAHELQTGKWSAEAQSAVALLEELAAKALELNYPLIVDM